MSPDEDEQASAESSTSARRTSFSLFHAAPPALPPVPSLGAPTNVFDAEGRYAKRFLWIFPLSLLISAAIIALLRPDWNTRGGAYLHGIAATPIAVVLIFLAVRRAYEAVGARWVYARRWLFGGGSLLRFGDLTDVEVVARRHGPPRLRLRDDVQSKKIFYSARQLELFGRPFARDLARGVLGSPATISPEAREFLSGYDLA
ncbi:MAG: hypothetical protein ACJ72E_10535 [Marmoricola sp.]